MPHLSVNIDHVATVRQARRTYEPDPVWAAVMAELGGADGITIHLREDRRHIQDRDLRLLRETISVPLNLELAAIPEMIAIACDTRPDQVTLVPERREEITTEGGLDLVNSATDFRTQVRQLQDRGIRVSFFLDPVVSQVDAAQRFGADAVELHTGSYALTCRRVGNVSHPSVEPHAGSPARPKDTTREEELRRLRVAADRINELGLRLHAGHGLNYHNVGPIACLPRMVELNIGHSLVARAFFVGLTEAVREMKQRIDQATGSASDAQ